jgi:hypothetical protein
MYSPESSRIHICAYGPSRFRNWRTSSWAETPSVTEIRAGRSRPLILTSICTGPLLTNTSPTGGEGGALGAPPSSVCAVGIGQAGRGVPVLREANVAPAIASRMLPAMIPSVVPLGWWMSRKPSDDPVAVAGP